MEDELFDDLSDSEYTGSFISSTDDFTNELTWDSEEDSRPPGPSPPSSSNMSESPVVRRLRRTRRRVYVEADTQSDEESVTVSQVSSMSDSNPPSPTVSTFMIHENADSQTESDSESVTPHSPTLSSSRESTVYVMSEAEEEPNSPIDLTQNLRPHSPDYPPPQENLPEENPPEVHPPQEQPVPQEPQDNTGVAPIEVPPVEVEAAAVLPEVLADAPQNGQSAESAQPQTPKTKASALNKSFTSDSDDNTLCSICLDPLTNSGNHRVVCLRCGHIFGQSCLERWIKVGCSNGAKRCPTCNKKACLKDIRILYFPKVVPLDTIERDRLLLEKEKLIQEKNLAELYLSKCKLQKELSARTYEEQIQKLEKELYDTKSQLKMLMQGIPIQDVKVTKLEKETTRVEIIHVIDLNKEGGCRVAAYNPILRELVVSQPSGNTLFAGFGVRVLNSVDFQPTRYVFLHSKMIRDLAFHPADRDLLLSVSLDHTAKLVDLASSTTVHTFKGDGPLWSCCWDASNPHLMLVGSQMGMVCQYDRRMTSNYVNMWTTDNNLTPVVSLVSMPCVANTPYPQGGFLSCRLNRVFSYAKHGNMYFCEALDLNGPFMSMRYDPVNQNLLTSSRPSSSCPNVRINLNLVDVNEKGNVCLPLIHTFTCGSSARVMSRLTSVPTLDDSLIVAHHESGRTLNLWSSKTGNLVHRNSITDPVIDLTNLSVNNTKCLFASLSEKRVCIYNVT